MDSKLLFQALTKFLLGIIILGLFIFLPAGSFHYWQGWLMMGVLFVPMFIAGIILMVKNPELLRKRLNAKEEEKATLILFLTMPLVLASPISFLIMLLYIPLITKRIRNEEAVLEQGLKGYLEYKQRVKYKVIPFIW